MAGDLQLPPGYEDAKAVQGLTLPPGYEDAKPAAASASPSTTPATPQPIPTAVNRMASRRNAQAQPTVTPAMRSAAAAPVITSAENALPAAGMVAGGVLGSVEPGAGNIAGAALGGMAGEQARRLIQGKPTTNKEAAIQTAGAGAQGATSEMGGQIIGKGIEVAAPYVSKGIETLSDLPPARKTTWFAPHTKTPGYDYAEASPSAIPDAAPTPAPPASTPVAGPPKPLTNPQIGKQVVAGVKEAAGTSDTAPIFDRNAPPAPAPKPFARPAPVRVPETIPAAGGPVQGTVGAKTVAEMPNTEIQGPPIATPSRNQTLTNYAGENVEKAAARTPMTPRNQGQFYEDFSPRERQDIHRDMEFRTPDGPIVRGDQRYEQIPGAQEHWDRLSKTPEVREDYNKMQNDQVREALRKSGLVDMQNKTVKGTDWVFQGKKAQPFRDPNVIPRAKALQMMWEKGIPDEDIIKWGGGEETRSKPYFPRTTAGPSREGLAAGPADRGYPEK